MPLKPTKKLKITVERRTRMDPPPARRRASSPSTEASTLSPFRPRRRNRPEGRGRPRSYSPNRREQGTFEEVIYDDQGATRAQRAHVCPADSLLTVHMATKGNLLARASQDWPDSAREIRPAAQRIARSAASQRAESKGHFSHRATRERQGLHGHDHIPRSEIRSSTIMAPLPGRSRKSRKSSSTARSPRAIPPRPAA